MKSRKDTQIILERLWDMYPDAECTLDDCGKEIWKLMIAGILGSQCTDARVNMITPVLFERFPSIEALADADLKDIEEIIRSCGFFRAKASYIKGSMNLLLDKYEGQVPSAMEDLLGFPGVGRKIANLILGDGFKIPGIVVDTHCARISKRIGFTKSENPVIVERDLTKQIPEDKWIAFGHRAVAHGRALCKARRPDCPNCALIDKCNYGRKYLGQV